MESDHDNDNEIIGDGYFWPDWGHCGCIILWVPDQMRAVLGLFQIDFRFYQGLRI